MAASYRVGSRDYLQRAKELRAAANEDRRLLFHSAFELRCGIEARLQEYLEVRDEVSKRLKSGWEIAKMARGLESVFESGDQVAELAYAFGDTQEIDYRLLYTPVTARLQEIGGRLGNYLHAKRKLSDDADPFWDEFKKLLDEGITLLVDATTGTLLGMPLQESKTGELQLFIEAFEGDPRTAKIASKKVGDVGRVKVSYHDKIPDYAR